VKRFARADVAELADVLDLGSSGRLCRLELDDFVYQNGNIRQKFTPDEYWYKECAFFT